MYTFWQRASAKKNVIIRRLIYTTYILLLFFVAESPPRKSVIIGYEHLLYGLPVTLSRAKENTLIGFDNFVFIWVFHLSQLRCYLVQSTIIISSFKQYKYQWQDRYHVISIVLKDWEGFRLMEYRIWWLSELIVKEIGSPSRWRQIEHTEVERMGDQYIQIRQESYFKNILKVL